MVTVVPNIEKATPRYHENKYFTVTLFLNVLKKNRELTFDIRFTGLRVLPFTGLILSKI